MNLKKIGIISIGFVFILISSPTWAYDKYPNKPIQIICTFPPGSGGDLSIRIICEKMQESLGQPVILLHKPGGNMALGISYVAHSKPDGYTILTVPEAIVLTSLTTLNLPYKLSDLIPIGSMVSYTYSILTNKHLPVKNLAELVAYAKKNPNTLNYTTGVIGGITYFMAELLKHNDQLDMQHIPFSGTAPRLTALLGNHIQVAFLPPSMQHIKSGEIRALSSLSEKRDPFLPGVPTAAEQGFPELIAGGSHILFAPAKTPAPVVKKLEDVLDKTLQDKEVQEKMSKLLYAVDFNDSQYMQRWLDNETKRLSMMLKKLNFVIK